MSDDDDDDFFGARYGSKLGKPYGGYRPGSWAAKGEQIYNDEKKREAEQRIFLRDQSQSNPAREKGEFAVAIIIVLLVLFGLGIMLVSSTFSSIFPPKTGESPVTHEGQTDTAPYIVTSRGMTSSPSVVQVTRLDQNTVKLEYLGGPTENKIRYIEWMYCVNPGTKGGKCIIDLYMGDPESTSPLPAGTTLYLNNVESGIKLHGRAYLSESGISQTIYDQYIV